MRDLGRQPAGAEIVFIGNAVIVRAGYQGAAVAALADADEYAG